MNIPPFRKLPTTDKALGLVQDNIKATLDAVLTCPLLSGAWMSAITLAAGSNTVGHPLGRAYRSYLLGPLSAAVTVYQSASPDRTRFLVLVASAPVVLDVFIY